jgi:hypothetical protein
MSTSIADSIRNSLHCFVAQQASLRQVVSQQRITQLTVVEQPASIMETTLIRDGVYCGRRFSLAGYSLIWFQEEGQVKLYGPDGALEQSCSLSQFCAIGAQTTQEIRRAA